MVLAPDHQNRVWSNTGGPLAQDGGQKSPAARGTWQRCAATTIPLWASNSAICSSVRGSDLCSIMSLITSLADRGRGKEVGQGHYLAEGMTYFWAVARETVDSCTPSSLRHHRSGYGGANGALLVQVLALVADQKGHDPLQRLARWSMLAMKRRARETYCWMCFFSLSLSSRLVLLAAHHQLR